LAIASKLTYGTGTYLWLLSCGVAVRNAASRPVRFIGSDVDTTDLKRAEGALRESEDRFRGTVANAAVGIAHEDVTGRFMRLNLAFTKRLLRQEHPPEPVAAVPPVLLRNLGVLVVVDNATNRRILEKSLRRW
jgi:PAS domain-containing protein